MYEEERGREERGTVGGWTVMSFRFGAGPLASLASIVETVAVEGGVVRLFVAPPGGINSEYVSITNLALGLALLGPEAVIYNNENRGADSVDPRALLKTVSVETHCS